MDDFDKKRGTLCSKQPKVVNLGQEDLSVVLKSSSESSKVVDSRRFRKQRRRHRLSGANSKAGESYQKLSKAVELRLKLSKGL